MNFKSILSIAIIVFGVFLMGCGNAELTEGPSTWESIVGFFLMPLVMWIVAVFLWGIYTWAVEQDSYVWSLIFTVGFIIIYWNWIATIFINWQLTLFVLGGYLLAGAIWSVYRWFRKCRTFVKNNPDKEKKWYKQRLLPSENKSQITGWIVYWPFSLVWNIVGDFLTTIFDSLQHVYEKVTDSVINKSHYI